MINPNHFNDLDEVEKGLETVLKHLNTLDSSVGAALLKAGAPNSAGEEIVTLLNKVEYFLKRVKTMKELI